MHSADSPLDDFFRERDVPLMEKRDAEGCGNLAAEPVARSKFVVRICPDWHGRERGRGEDDKVCDKVEAWGRGAYSDCLFRIAKSGRRA